MSNQPGRKRKAVKKILSSLSPLTSGKEQIRKELEVSEQKYKTAFEYTGTGMLIIEEDMTISLINQRICEMTGYTHEEIEGNKKWTDIVVVKDVERLSEYHKLRRINPELVPAEYEFHYHHKNGSIRDSLINVSMIPGSKKSLISMLDITERKKMEMDLRDSEHRYRDLFENANDIIYIHDARGDFITANTAALSIYGYSYDEMKKLNIRDILDPRYHEEAFNSIKQRIATGKPGEPYEWLSYKKSREPVWVEVKSRLLRYSENSIGIQGIARDITDRKTIEKKLRESEKRFKETAELLPSIICEFDKNLKFIYTNKTGLESFGYTFEEFEKGISIEQLISKSDFERAKQNLSLLIKGKSVKPQEYQLRHKDGTVFDYFVTSSPIVKEDTIAGVRTCAVDISDRKRFEIQLKESEERLRSIFAASPIGIAIFNCNGYYIDINHSFKNLFGLPENVDYSKIQFSLLQYLDKLKLNSAAIIGGKGTKFETNDDFNFIKSKENYEIIPMNKRVFEWQITPLGIESGYARYFLAQVQDITERKKREEAKLSKAQKIAEDANRMIEGLRKEINKSANFCSIISRSPAMQEIFNILPEIAQTSTTVLITGESGTGKELIAKSIHELGPRKSNRFIAINCGALPDNLLESELYGYKAGAFTDAKKDKSGKFAQAHRGTIFLDEIGDISSAMQVKLLRVLQERTVEPLGSTKSIPIDVHVIAATNKNLHEMVKNGEFREDLYYRIKVLNISLPPLRDRKLDIPLLCDHFISIFNARYKKNITELSSKSLNLLLAHDYPGNIRELENILEHSFIFCRGGKIEPSHLPSEVVKPHNFQKKDTIFTGIKSFNELERMFIKHILLETGGSKIKAAEKLGIHKATLFRKIKNLGIE
ncbi:MAG: PAS domain S-box protein [Chitinispirillia bacterium]|jgi:PAS domain S-box-containing protein